MKTIIFFLLVSCCSVSSFSQKLLMDVLDPTGSNAEMRSGVSKSQIVGSVFLTDWQDGFLMYGSKREKKTMRYNAFQDAVHIRDEQGKEIIIQPGQVESFIVVDKGVEYKFKWLTGIPKFNFSNVQVIYENQVKLYYKHHRKLKQSNSGTENYTNSPTNDALVQDDYFVIVLPDNTVHLTKAKKKEILSIFGKQKAALEEFIKKENIDTQNLKGLSKVIIKYEELSK